MILLWVCLLLLIPTAAFSETWVQQHSAAGRFLPSASEVEMTGMRNRNTKVFSTGKAGQFRTAQKLSPVHYKSDPWSATEAWKDIDLTINLTPSESWDAAVENNGYQVHFWQNYQGQRYVAQFRRGGKWIAMAPVALVWVNKAGQRDVISTIVTGVSPTINNASHTVTWSNAFGAGIHFQYNVQPDHFFKTVMIENLTDLPPPGINQNELRLVIVMKVKWDLDGAWSNNFADAVTSEDLGTGTDPESPDEALESIAADISLDDATHSYFRMVRPKAWDSDEPRQEIDVRWDLRRKGEEAYGLFSIPAVRLNSATFPVYIDASIKEEVIATANDWELFSTFSNTNTFFTWGANGSPSAATQGVLFANTSILPDAVIDSASIAMWFNTREGKGPHYILIQANDVDNATPATTFAEANNTYWDLTTASYEWYVDTDNVIDKDVWYYTPSLSSIVQEVVDRPGWEYGNSFQFMFRDASTSSNETHEPATYDSSSAESMEFYCWYSYDDSAFPEISNYNVQGVSVSVWPGDDLRLIKLSDSVAIMEWQPTASSSIYTQALAISGTAVTEVGSEYSNSLLNTSDVHSATVTDASWVRIRPADGYFWGQVGWYTGSGVAYASRYLMCPGFYNSNLVQVDDASDVFVVAYNVNTTSTLRARTMTVHGDNSITYGTENSGGPSTGGGEIFSLANIGEDLVSCVYSAGALITRAVNIERSGDTVSFTNDILLHESSTYDSKYSFVTSPAVIGGASPFLINAAANKGWILSRDSSNNPTLLLSTELSLSPPILYYQADYWIKDPTYFVISWSGTPGYNLKFKTGQFFGDSHFPVVSVTDYIHTADSPVNEMRMVSIEDDKFLVAYHVPNSTTYLSRAFVGQLDFGGPTATPTPEPTPTPTPIIHVDQPNTGSEQWVIGDVHEIIISVSSTIDSVTLEISDDNKASWVDIAIATSYINAASSYHYWLVEGVDANTNLSYVRVSMPSDAWYDESDNAFSLLEPSPTPTPTPMVSVDQPNGGETWVNGNISEMIYSVSGNDIANVTLEYWDGISWNLIASETTFINAASTYQYWLVSAATTASASFRVSLVSTWLDTSDAVYEIVDPTPTPTPAAWIKRVPVIEHYKRLFIQ